MNELALGTLKIMPTKEATQALGVSVDTVQNVCKTLQATSENFPKFSQGQRAVYNEQQVQVKEIKLESQSRKVMTVAEVARVLGYDSEYLRKKCTELGFTKNGVKTVLNEEQVTKLKSVLVPRSSDMKVRGQNAVTHLEMLQNIQRDMQWLISYNAELQAENERQKQELALQQPKVDTYNRIANSTGLKTMQEVAKILKIGSNTLFSVLRDKGVFYRSNGVNLPQEKYIKQGLFEVKEEPYKRDNKDFVYTRVFATAKGLLWLEKQIDTQK